MLKIDPGYDGRNMRGFLETLEFARQADALDEFLEQIRYLENYSCADADPGRTCCVLSHETGWHSFGFLMLVRDDKWLESESWPTEGQYRAHNPSGYWIEGRPYRMWFNGGLIYSGPGVPSDGSAPSFTVSLDPTCYAGKEHRWSVHT